MSKQHIADKLYEIGALKFGSFTLKSGMESPFYVDIRLIISYPELLKEIAQEMWTLIEKLTFDSVCGVPYTALPIATAISLDHNIPMLMKRKEEKTYGTKRIIEGVYESGQTTLIVEDIITSGKSIIETVGPLEDTGLKITDIAVLINREQGGVKKVEALGYKIHALFSISELLDLIDLDHKTIEACKTFIANNQV
ncbi:MAG: orotate phosphoribosyltransferase [Simkaniaceae bacterium]|nr:orotate phosphoribosyltransferase [Simkaniaceae bacterium]